MSGYSNESSGSSSSNSNFSQDIPAFQQAALKKLYGQAENIFKDVNAKTSAQTPGINQYVANVSQAALPAFQANVQGGVYKDLGFGNQLSNSLQQSLNNPSATSQIYANIMGGQGNNYADALKASFIGDANRAQDNMLANLDARAAASGMSGGSRHGLATSQGLYDINSNLQKNLADVGYQTFDQDWQNKLGIAQQADQGTLARQQMLSDLLGQQQGTVTGALDQGATLQNLGMGQFAPTMIPWQNMSNYSNVIGSPTVLSKGNSNSSSQLNSKGGGGGI